MSKLAGKTTLRERFCTNVVPGFDRPFPISFTATKKFTAFVYLL